MHLLHRNRKYGNFNEAANHRSGFVALIALYRNVDVDNEVLLELFESINEVKEPGTEVDVEKTIMLRDLLPRNIRDYYYYKGFLTDPPCSESVLQIVFAEQLQCSDQDVGIISILYLMTTMLIPLKCCVLKVKAQLRFKTVSQPVVLKDLHNSAFPN